MFYDMCVTTGVECVKIKTLFNVINDKFLKDEIPWQNAFSVGLDNTSANIVIRNSVKSCMLQKNLNCLIAGSNCYLAHLPASKGAAAYHKNTSFDIEEHQVDLCFIFIKSTRRKGIG